MDFLIEPINDSAIKDALFQIGDDKAPGPDGYTTTFFKRNWDLIKNDFLAVVHEFFRNSRLLKQVNHAAIALIPKTKHDPGASDFRPISCCNVFYKTISKIIASRLATIIPTLVDPAQSAFLEERLMNDNILLAQQLIRRYGRKSCTPRCMLMVDIKKAYDSLSWEFMINLLICYGFPPLIVAWIKECITTPTASISLNGKIHGFIKVKRSLRQGDPLSPYLFVMAMDYLSRILKAYTKNPDFKDHPKCEQIGLTHLAFADTIILFSRGVWN